jgi:hypothetical protein
LADKQSGSDWMKESKLEPGAKGWAKSLTLTSDFRSAMDMVFISFLLSGGYFL